MAKYEISAPTFNIWKQSKLPKKTHGIVQTYKTLSLLQTQVKCWPFRRSQNNISEEPRLPVNIPTVYQHHTVYVLKHIYHNWVKQGKIPKPIYNLQSSIWDPGNSVIIWLLLVCVCMCVYYFIYLWEMCAHKFYFGGLWYKSTACDLLKTNDEAKRRLYSLIMGWGACQSLEMEY